MRADTFLAAAEALPFADLDTLTRGHGLVVLAPHPDDESLGCGGLIAQACARGLPARLIVVSDGVGSHPNSPSYPPERLRALREEETLAAAHKLGLPNEQIDFLRLPDRHVPGTGPAAEAAAEVIAAVTRESRAGSLFVTWGHDPHCDHQACAALARLVRARLPELRLFAYPVWGWALPAEVQVGPAPNGIRLDITKELDVKRAAIAAHRSQTSDMIDDDPDGFRLDEAMLARFARPFEIFLEMNA